MTNRVTDNVVLTTFDSLKNLKKLFGSTESMLLYIVSCLIDLPSLITIGCILG